MRDAVATEGTRKGGDAVRIAEPASLVLLVAGIDLHVVGTTVTLDGRPVAPLELDLLIDALQLAQSIGEAAS